MPKVRGHAFIAAVLLLINGIPYIHTQATVASSLVNQDSSLPRASTCPARTVNYITQTLPQQCFKTGWSEGNVPKSLAGKFEQSISGKENVGVAGSPVQLETHNATAAFGQAVKSVATAAMGSDKPSFLSETTGSSTTVALEAPSATLEADLGSDSDSPLDNPQFLSFEDWKKRNLAKAGQSADAVGQGRIQPGDSEPRRRPGSINNALDSLGEDTEIELDFTGFVSPVTAADALPPPKTHSSAENRETDAEGHAESQDGGLQGATQRSKDAGTTCKERSNYASFDCAATVLKTNLECKGSTSILVENKDSYMLNECSAKNKFFIVELCDDILVDTVVLANFEFFSSMFRSFRVSVSDRYPIKMERWKELGTFVASNSREVQAFAIESPLIWARYLRIEFLTHFGNEYYCPVSLLRVHGTTMIEEFRHQEEAVLGEDDIDEQAAVGVAKDEDTPEATGGVKEGQTAPPVEQPNEGLHESTSIVTKPVVESSGSPTPEVESKNVSSEPLESPASGFTPANSSWNRHQGIFATANPSDYVCYPGEHKADASDVPNAPAVGIGANARNEMLQETIPIALSENVSSAIHLPTGPSTQPATTAASSSSLIPFSNGTETRSNFTTPTSTMPSSKSQSNQTAQAPIKPSSSLTQPSTANPTTQESFFKSIHKRLQLLESNSTLSLQYIEEQSRILRDAFNKVEKRQLAKTTSFLEILNTTVLSELRDFRQQYDQIWQSTVLELSSQREQSQREVIALSARLRLLADEILFQKRMAILQFILILLCLGLVIFSRSATAGGMSDLELPPLVQNMVDKSSLSKANYAAFESPPTSPRSTRPTSRNGIFRRGAGPGRNMSEDSKGITRDRSDRTGSPTIAYSPPTPTSEHDLHSDADESAGQRSLSPALSDSPEADVQPREARSSPVTPSGTRVTQDPMEFHQSGDAEETLLRPDGDSPRRRSPLSENMVPWDDDRRC